MGCSTTNGHFFGRYRLGPGAGLTPSDPGRAIVPIKRESVQEFVAFFYEYIRDDAAMTATLDRALKERYQNGNN